jgi:hypothetical protein
MPSGYRRHARDGIRQRAVEPDVARLPNLSAVRPVAKTQLRPGVVVWAHIPFVEVDTEKTRPAIVKATVGRQVTLLPATSAASRHRFPSQYVELRELRPAGLSRPTGVQRREVTIDLIEIVDIVGTLSDDDLSTLLDPPAHALAAASGDAA